MKYKVNKIGFVNFWLYNEEEFSFCDGKLLLRGTNGSGKTVTMQSFFPLIFDGNKSPERLDPFGSRDRKIEDYLLPDDFTGNENTGYLYMEFVNEKKQYLTIGIGLRAIRNRPCEFWGFSVTDNRRIGKDFLLFKERNLRIPLTKKELEVRIGTGGELVDTQKKYKEMVNKLLFGFPNLDLYTEFINLMIQVRSPKLSNSTRPSQLTKILSSVLEPLSENDLRIMADAIEDMNKYKEELADLFTKQKACNSLKNYYDDYNHAILSSKLADYLHYKNETSSFQKQIENLKAKNKSLVLTMEQEKKLQENLILEQQKLEDRKNYLEESDLKNIAVKLDEILSSLADYQKQKENKEEQISQKETTYLKNKKEFKELEDNLFSLEQELKTSIQILSDYEKEIHFDDAKFYLDDLKKEGNAFKQMQSYKNTMQKQLDLLKGLEELSYKVYMKELEIGQYKEDYAVLEDKGKISSKKQQEISTQLLELCTSLKEKYATISQQNKAFILNQDHLNTIYEIIDSCDKEMFLKIKEELQKILYSYQETINSQLTDLEKQIILSREKIKKEEENFHCIETIFTQHLTDEETIKYFKENNISYEYFYEGITFKENVPIEIRKRIESFLLETGILTSFITNIPIISSKVKVKCLEKGKTVNHNLTEFLESTSIRFPEKVKGILESISYEKIDSFYIDSNGEYSLALFKGKIDCNHELRYIGNDVRNEYIVKEKEKINLIIKQYSLNLQKIELEKQNLFQQLTILKEEINKFPYPEEILNTLNLLEQENNHFIVINQQLNELLEIIKEKNNELNALQENLQNHKHGYYNSLNYLDIKEVLKNTNIYFETIKSLEMTFDSYLTKFEQKQFYLQILEENTMDLDYLKNELDIILLKIKDIENKKETMNDLLNSDKYKDVGKEYTIIKERLHELKEEIPYKIKLITSCEKDIEKYTEEITRIEAQLNDMELYTRVMYKIFRDEYNLHYVSKEELNENNLLSIKKKMRQPNLSVSDLYDKLAEASNKYLPELLDYASKNVTIHMVQENAYLEFTNDSSKEIEINKLLQQAKRRDFIFNYKGKNVTLFELISIIDNSITAHQDLISEENRRLFEDLLTKNIGSSIRNKINLSEEWISEVKALMESMNTSSGLSFSLKWNGIEAFTEEEMDTKEIVKIFRTDAAKLKEEDLNKITKHFSSKIKLKEESLEENERNYLEIIKEVLDYRKWFEFKLYYQRNGKEKRELTDREFNKMSGGEKAIAMYIPLFASIYAKLNSAYPTAPRIIALDEAFAGVDDENIKDAFRILAKLDIDYVLTSQQLWGDYETIKHLAISELHHPLGSKIISIIKYKWDGVKRSHVLTDDDYE